MNRTEIKRKTPLKPGKPPARKKPLPRGKGIKKSKRPRHKATPKGRRGRMEAETERRVMAFFRGLPCIVCRFLAGRLNTNTCGHHIVPKSRCRSGRHDPANLAPVCSTHHKMGNDIAPHSSNPLASAAFDRLLEKHMPKRFAETRLLDQRAKRGPKYTINEVEQDHAFWLAVEENNRDYEFICAAAGVEAWASDAALKEQADG